MEEASVSLDAAKMDELILDRKYDEISDLVSELESRQYKSSRFRAENYYIIGNGYAILADSFKSSWDWTSG
jgi:hypothetical protein